MIYKNIAETWVEKIIPTSDAIKMLDNLSPHALGQDILDKTMWKRVTPPPRP